MSRSIPSQGRQIQVDGRSVTYGGAIPDDVMYDFESGDTSNWDSAPELSADATRVYNGSWAGYVSNSPGTALARVIPTGYSEGYQPSKFQYFWNETSNSKGAGIRLYNTDGNYEIGVAANNPEWSVYDGNGHRRDVSEQGLTYNSWVRFTILFDWVNGTYSLNFEHFGDNYTYTESGSPLRYGKDIEEIVLDNQDDGVWRNGDPVDMWYDDIEIFN